jgi:hypothetical protein
MINPIYILLIFCCINTTAIAQTAIELNIQHKFGKSNFVAGQPYMDEDNRAILINEIQYYVSDIQLIYDGGQIAAISNQHFLIDGETDSYNLGTVSETIQELEFIDFNLGIDAVSNSNLPSTYSTGHPLAKQQMYSVDEQSYVFIVIHGLIDSDNDQVPDKPFSFKATGDQLLRQIHTESKTPAGDNSLKINLVANVASWLSDIDLDLVGIQENSGVDNEKICDNTQENKVFYNVATTSVNSIVSPQNHIYVDSRLSYAPTIHYKFYSSEELDMTITSVTGAYFIQRFNLNPAGDFYMDDNLAAGIYIVVFSSPKGIRQSKRFVIRN